jgi:L-seryl-tRNA(Ser) seleniumtransferase
MDRPAQSVVDGSKASPKDLPSVDRLLRAPAGAALVATQGHTLVAAEARALLETLRERALAGTLPGTDVSVDLLVGQLHARVSSLRACVASSTSPAR